MVRRKMFSHIECVDLAYSPPALLRLLRQDRGSLRSANEDDEDASARRFQARASVRPSPGRTHSVCVPAPWDAR